MPPLIIVSHLLLLGSAAGGVSDHGLEPRQNRHPFEKRHWDPPTTDAPPHVAAHSQVQCFDGASRPLWIDLRQREPP
eukprot:SAG11_NODE_24886_length_366_cov_1.516854_1_plen_76_part_10